MKKIIFSKDAPAPIGPYSQAVMSGTTLYVSGQIAWSNKEDKLITDNIAAETEQVMKNLKAVLSEAGFELSNIVKCTIFIRNMDDFNDINEVYGSYFDESLAPARETVEVSRLPKDVNIEISCIAVGKAD